MKKIMKIVNVLIILIAVIMSINTVVLATEGVTDPGELKGKQVSGTEKMQDVGNEIITIVTTLGSITSVVVLVVLGLKYMMGSPDEKAEYKKTLLPYIIGAVLVFAASTVAGAIFGFANNI